MRWRFFLTLEWEVIMDAAFSFLISVGIIAFGIWIVAGTIAAGSPLAWALMGTLTVMYGRPPFGKGFFGGSANGSGSGHVYGL